MTTVPLLGIISGGQTGADQAGLRAAKALGLTTGGLMPKGFRTESGPRPHFRELYGMGESRFGGYQPRTRWNIQHADATIIFSLIDQELKIPSEPGSALTMGLCSELQTPCLVVEWDQQYRRLGGGAQFKLWMEQHHVTILNVAGNRESHAPGIGQAVEDYLLRGIRQMQ